MKGYIFTIIAVSVISGIISSMLSNSKTGLKKFVNFISGLICAIALLSPIVTIANNMNSFSSSIEGFIDTLNGDDSVSTTNKIIIDTGTENICRGIKNTVISKYGFSENDVNINAKINADNIEAITLEEIEITLKNQATWIDEYNLKDFVENLVGCKVKIKKI